MRLDEQRASDNVEDRRRMGTGPMIAGGGLVGLVIAVIVMLMGGNPQKVMEQMGQQQQQQARGGGKAEGERELTPEEEKLGEFVKKVLGSTEDVWDELLPKEYNKKYVRPTLVLFSGRTESACGSANAAVGPFYCPADQKVYIDLAFYKELQDRFKAPGDFAQAYVIAHEIGHHIQNQLGQTEKVHRLQGRVSKAEYNQASVRLELQADFYAGVWAHHAQKKKGILDAGDIREGLRCASAIGDDTLQQEAQGYVRPESFTHGSSEQRMRWFEKGLKTGDMRQGDTFAADEL